MHYSATYADTSATDSAPGAAAYDAAYLLAYAAFARGGESMTGQELARAIARLAGPGLPIEVGPAKIFEAFHALRDGKDIDLLGAATLLDFDLATGDSTVDFSVQCIRVDKRGKAVGSADSGMVFRGSTQTLQGTFACP
jgi:branched-chain amino acid transport system substrate-binding protein